MTDKPILQLKTFNFQLDRRYAVKTSRYTSNAELNTPTVCNKWITSN